MKAKVTRGSGFRGALNYLFGDNKNAQIVGGNMSGLDPRQLSSEFSASRKLRPDIAKPVWQCSLALPKGETVSPEKWNKICERFLEMMEIPAINQAVFVRHGDTSKDHVHVLASRVGLDNTVWHGKWEAIKAINATQELEKEFGLTLTAGLGEPDLEQTAVSQAEIEISIKSGEAIPREMLFDAVKAAAVDGPSVTAFINRLDQAGIAVMPNVASTGRLNGFSFHLRGHTNSVGEPVFFKGSDLGKSKNKLTWKKLQQLGVTYEQATESARLIRIKEAGIDAENSGGIGHSRTNQSDGTKFGEADRGSENSNPTAKQSEQEISGVGEADSGIYGSPKEGINQGRKDGQRSEERPVEGSETAQQNEAGSVLPNRTERWNNLASELADFAAPIDCKHLRNRDEIPVDHKTKLDAWQNQHNALLAPAYRITLKSRRDDLNTFILGKAKDKASPAYTANELAEKIGQLRRLNAKGYDVYITPIDDKHHYIVVDDMTPDTMRKLEAQGYKPTLTQESSANNQQAILKIQKQASRGKAEQSLANKVVQQLNQQYGDPKFTGVIHPFRMAGFANKKPNKNNAFTRILRASHWLCDKASQLLQSLRKTADRDAQAALNAKKLAAIKNESELRIRQIHASPDNLNAVISQGDTARYQVLFKQELKNAEEMVKQGVWGEVNLSVIDYRVCCKMLMQNSKVNSIKNALIAVSPMLANRHPQTDDYVARTLQKAFGDERVQQYLAKKEAQRLKNNEKDIEP